MSNPELTDLHQLLSRVPLFQNAPERALEIAAAAVRKRVYEPNTTVFQEGDKGEALYILESGLVKLSKVDLGGHEKTLAILQTPAYFGEMALLGESTRSATAVTLGVVNAYLLFNDDFRKLIADYPTISLNLNATLAERLRGMDDESQILSYKDAQGRVAYVLLRLFQGGVVEHDNERALVRLTHQELANLAGTSRETVTRALKALESEGVIETRPKEVFITDPQGLDEILHGIR
ncbi:MAG TPA: Crp/Fnr family transcriptional regulator [Trueperaceae bacterium]|nr:Crp/Fnr family transcriptional regulator [Trueperaceae bacterium]HRP46667.1 Crp/Fnr family transcriptional regulator [Trueperaceae bacterium]